MLFTNSMHIVVPTGVTLSMTGGMVLMAIAAGWFILSKKRRKATI
jgi:LPXTG-motif cell wall-anchored protein